MKKSSQTLRKVLAAALAVAVIGSTGMTTAVGSVVGLNTSVSASDTVIVTHGDFTYYLYSDHTAEIASYNGTKDLSTKSLGCPSVVYAKDLDQYYFNGYTGSYTVTRLQAEAFSGCKIRILGLPNNLQVLFGGFWNAEIGCFSIATDNSYFTSDTSGVLYNKSKTTLVAYPSNPSLYGATSGFFLQNTCTKIDNWALTNCKLTSITVPSTVAYVGRGAFQYSSLYSVTFAGSPSFWCANTDEIGTFDDATNLDSITINGTSGKYSTYNGAIYNKDQTVLMYCPEGRTTSSAFAISSKATKIGNYAFRNCKKLTAICIPETITSIGEYEVFYNTNKNLVLYVTQDSYGHTYAKNNNMTYKVIYSYTKKSDNTLKITGYDGPWNSFTIPSKINGYTVSEIGAEAFKGKTNITSVSIPSTVTAIGDKAFYSCSKLSSISLPSTVTSIGKDAFYNTAVTSITIPSSMTAIGEEAFYGMFKLESVTIPSKVTSIGKYAFGFDSSLTSVTIPNNVTSIGFAAFYGCSKLSSLTLGSGVTSISGSAFCNTALTSQYIPKTVTSVGSYAFGYKYADSTYTRDSSFTEISGYPGTAAQSYCKNYNVPFRSLLQYSTSSDGKSIKIEKYTGTDTNIVIPDKIDGLPVTSIGSYAFNGTNVTSITLPANMTALDGYALYGASKLTTVKFPSGITSIGNYAFEFCSSLKSITIPSTVTSIGSGAFYGCTSLASVSFSGTSLKSIGSNAFCNTALTSVNIPKSVTTIGGHAFGYTYKNSEFAKVSGFSITGYAYGAADTYATENGFTFNPLYEAIINNSTISKTAITLGDSVTINFASTGGKKPITYAAMYSLDGGSSVSICSHSTNTSTTFTPSKAGTYAIYTYAKDDRGNFIRKDFTLTVETLPVENTSEIWNYDQKGQTEFALDDTVYIETGATGGNGSYSYSIYYHTPNVDNWQTAVENSTKTGVPFHLTDENGDVHAGQYEIVVVARDTYGKYGYKTFNVTVYDRLVNMTEVSSESVTVGDTVTGYLDAQGGAGDYTYTIRARYNGGEWITVVEDFAPTQYSYIPNIAGTYEFEVTAKDRIGTTAIKEFTIEVKQAVKALTSTSTISMEGEVYKNDIITIYASAEGGTAPYTYAAYCKKTSDTKWVTLQNFSSNSTIEFALTDVADYEVCVKVKDATGTIVKDYYELSVIVDEEKLVNESTISPETTSVGKKVTFTGKASGGTGDYQYSFLYKKASDNKWVNKQSFSTNDTVSIKPESAVDYDVCIKVKDSSGAIEKKYFTLHVNEALVNTSTISSTSIIKGQTLTVTATGENGVAPYTYEVYYKKSTQSKWTTKQDFAENNTVEVKPAGTGLYEVCVKVKDNLGTIAKVYFDVEVTAAAELSSNSTISATEIRKGQSVTLNAVGVGGVAPYTYSVQYKQQSKSKWTTQQEFDSNDTIVVTPASATAYDICVKVQDSVGTVAKQYFVVTVS